MPGENPIQKRSTANVHGHLLWLALLPLIHFALIAGLAWARGPFHLAGNIDPEFFYLLNAVKVTELSLPNTVHHPGTSVLLITAVVICFGIVFNGLGGDWQSRIASAIEHHDTYLAATAWIQVLIIVVLSYLVGLRIYRLTRSVWPALAAQIAPLLSFIAISHSFRVSAEPMQIAAGLGLLYVLAPLTLARDASERDLHPSRALWVGAWLALGIATRYNFIVAAPLLLVLPGWRERRRGVLACGVCLLVLMLPVLGNADQFFSFAGAKLGTAGADAGPAGQGYLAEFPTLLGQAWRENPTVSWAMLLFFVAAFVASAMMEPPENQRYRRAIAALYAGFWILAAHLLLATLRIRSHYFVTALAIVYIMAPHLVYLLQTARLNRCWRYGLTAATALLAGQSLLAFRTDYRDSFNHHRGSRDQAFLLAEKRAEMPECEVIGYYRSSVPGFGLGFGNYFTHGYYGEALELLRPKQLAYKQDRLLFQGWHLWNQRSAVEERMAAGECVTLQGDSYRQEWIPGMQRHPLYFPAGYEHSFEGMFRLSLDASNPALFDYNPLPGNAAVLEAEDFTSGSVHRAQRDGLTIIEAAPGPADATYSRKLRGDRRSAIQVRYASADSRPLQLWLNGELVMEAACILATGESGTVPFRWHDLGAFRMRKGENTIRFASDGAFPAIDKIAFVEIP